MIMRGIQDAFTVHLQFAVNIILIAYDNTQTNDSDIYIFERAMNIHTTFSIMFQGLPDGSKI